MPASHTTVTTASASRYLQQLCKHWSHKFSVEFTPERGIIPFDATRVVNDCGRLTWPDTIDLIRSAACVIGNNSGIAHLAAFEGVPTVCVFGGAHQRLEWRPIGSHVVTLSRAIACSPCHLHHAAACPYGLACLTEIGPDLVCDAVERLMAGISTETFADAA